MTNQYTEKDGLRYHNEHIVAWCTKYKIPFLEGELAEAFSKELQKAAEGTDAEVELIKVAPDHVVIRIRLDPRLNLHQIIKTLKHQTSGLLFKQFPALQRRSSSLWTRRYQSCSVGSDPEQEIAAFVAQEKTRYGK